MRWRWDTRPRPWIQGLNAHDLHESFDPFVVCWTLSPGQLGDDPWTSVVGELRIDLVDHVYEGTILIGDERLLLVVVDGASET